MTTPQAILSNLEYSVRTLCDLLEGDEENGNILERLKQIELENSDIIYSMQRQENLMNIIIKLLSEDGKRTTR